MQRSAPNFSVRIFQPSKAAVRVDVTKRVLTVEVDDVDAMADKIDLSVDNFDLTLFDDPMWKTGNMMEISWGYAGNMTKPRDFIITKITGSLQLKIIAFSRSMLMNTQQKSKTFTNQKRSQVAATIAKAYGYTGDQLIIDDTKVVQSSIVQAKLTDAALLMDMAKKEGFVFFIDFDGFHFHRRKFGKAPKKKLVYYTDLTGEILRFDVENDVTVKPGRINAVGRDPLKKTDIKVTADNASTDRAALQPVIEIVDPRTGQTHLQPMAAEHTMTTTAADAASAKREADGRFIKTQQTTVLITFDCIGDPDLGAKMVIEVAGISKRLSGRYYITKAVHKISSSEYTMVLHGRTDGTQGVRPASNVKNDGHLNTKGVADPNALHPVEIVDPHTGQTSTKYVKGDPNVKGES